MYIKTDFSDLEKLFEELIDFSKATATKPFGCSKTNETSTVPKKTCKNKCYEEDIDGILKTVLGNVDRNYQHVEDDKYKTFYFALPGHLKQDISVKIENNNLIVKSLRAESLFVKKDYEKTIKLSNDLDLDNYKTKLENGVLCVGFPKINKTKEIVID